MSRTRQPTTLGLRLALLIASVLLLSNLLAFGAMLLRRDDMDLTTRFTYEAERVRGLVAALEDADPKDHPLLTMRFNTRYTRYSVDTFSIAEQGDPEDRPLERAISRAVPQYWVDAVHISHEGRVLHLASIELYARLQHHPIWLNVVLDDGPRVSPSRTLELLWLPMAVSMVATLGVALLFMRQITRPLSDFTRAAEVAGNGDRAARVPEVGGRELRTAARAFNRMQEKIAGFEDERRRLVASIGHDLRTPITSLRFRAEMVEDPRLAEAMIATLDDMTHMAEDLLAYGRGTSANEAVVRMDLSRLLAQLCEDLGAEFSGPGPVEMALRPVAIRRAFANLVENALRYGVVALVALERHEGQAIVTIRDAGPGLGAEALERAFDPFFRDEDSRSPSTGGTGLGLGIAQGIILRHGGTIALANHPEGGLEVTVTLPLR